MKSLANFKEIIHKCSKCGLCQQKCPIYKITGNDCSVSRGQFRMLEGIINGELALSNKVNYYLDLCLKCHSCSKICPAEIDVTDIIIAAKNEYFNKHFTEKLISFFQKYFLFDSFIKFSGFLQQNIKSKTYPRKVLFFNGCSSVVQSNKSIVKILNSAGIEVISPKFNCCGNYMLLRGDLEGFNGYIRNFVKIVKKYDIKEIVVNCASCEKTLKSYAKWAEDDETKKYLETVVIKNVFEYLKEENLKLKLKNKKSVTYHKPCNLENFSDVEWVLNNTENLTYVQMENYDACCGFNGICNGKNFNIVDKIFLKKREDVIKSRQNIVLTSCFKCQFVLKILSLFAYKTEDLLTFLAKNLY